MSEWFGQIEDVFETVADDLTNCGDEGFVVWRAFTIDQDSIQFSLFRTVQKTDFSRKLFEIDFREMQLVSCLALVGARSTPAVGHHLGTGSAAVRIDNRSNPEVEQQLLNLGQ